MATRATRRTNGNGYLEAAVALLMQNQTQFLTHLSETRKEFADMKKELDLIKALLIRHEDTLQKLPEAIREKIGYKQ
jgi:hypothetical protein